MPLTPRRCARLCLGFLALFSATSGYAAAAPQVQADALFRFGTNAYYAGDYAQAAGAFAQAATLHPASGTLQNLGNAEWQSGRTGAAVLAWEQALWLDPFNGRAKSNLRFARRTAQLETPDLAWYEAVSSWLPADCWAWMAAASLWGALAISTVPGVLRFPRASWHQAVAALGLAVFLLSVPAHVGVSSRAHLGFIIRKDAPLRLTPTADAQFIARLPAGEPARCQRQYGDFLLVRTSHAAGWVRQDEFQLICSRTAGAPQRHSASPAG